MIDDKHWPSFPFLQALRPEPGEVVDAAILTTYSADLVVVAACLLALAGLDDDRGSGSKVDFANAFERLNGRFRVLCQRGRILAPFRNLLILNLMDRFVREIGTNENTSWHPKTALVRYLRQDGSSSWRFWLGSRNLTRSVAWELGLLLVSSSSSGQPIEGLGAVGESLSLRAGLDTLKGAGVRRELDGLRWKSPNGIRVGDLAFWEPGQERELPDPPSRLKRLVVVSPFLDGTVIGRLGTWGEDNTERILVSTLPELKKLSTQVQQPLAGFGTNLRYLDAPVEDDIEADAEAVDSISDEEFEARGLHAKLLYAEHGTGRTLWMGSANATQRGWLGRNSEVIARVLPTSDLAEGLNAFLDAETREVYAGLLESVEPVDPDEEKIDSIRTALAASWNLRQEVDGRDCCLCGAYDPYGLAADMEVQVGRLGETLLVWPEGSRRLLLPPTTQAGMTEFVVISLQLGQRNCRWVQVAPISGFDADGRDKMLMGQYLDVRTFLSWIRSLLDGSLGGDGGGDWDRVGHRPPAGQKGNSLSAWAPTLEQALKAWIRNPEKLRQADAALRRYLETIQASQAPTLTAEDIHNLEAVKKIWPVIRRELVPDGMKQVNRK